MSPTQPLAPNFSQGNDLDLPVAASGDGFQIGMAAAKASMMSSLSTSDPTGERESALVAAIAAGCRESESLFVARYMPRVRTMLLIRSRNPELARDLQQDVMIEALCALRKGRLREAERLPAFVAGITRNVLNSHFRNQTRTPVHEELPEEIADLSEANPMDSDEARERRQLAQAAIASLDAADRAILQMTLVENLKPGVIADRLGLKPDVVRQRKLRATRRVMEFVRKLAQPGQAGTPISRTTGLSQNATAAHRETGGS